MLTFIMKAVVVLSFVLNLRFCLSIPIASSTENVPEQIEKSSQTDTVPIALVLVVPSSLPQFRDEEIHDGEDITFIEDHLINLLLRDAETPFIKDHARIGRQNEEFLLHSEDLNALNPLLREDGEEIEVNIVVEKPISLSEDINLPQLRDDKDVKENYLQEEQLPSISSALDRLSSLNLPREDIKSSSRPEDFLPSTEDDTLALRVGDEIISERKPITNDNPLERSYEYAAPPTHKPAEQVVATYPEASESALPILLNCAPKVVQGHLAETAPSYRSHNLKPRMDLGKESDGFETGDVIQPKDSDVSAKNSDVLDLNSPASIITVNRRKRYALSKTSATHYKVSEDYPETFKGNHHIVSADYPQPNMVKITEQET